MGRKSSFVSVAASWTLRGVAAFALTACTENAAPIPVATVTLLPSTDSVAIGATRNVVGRALDVNSNILSDRKIVYTTGQVSVATVDENGNVRGVGAGTTFVYATSEAKVAQMTMKVIQSIGTILVVPSSVDVPFGTTRQLTVSVNDPSGASISGRVLSFTSSNTAVATVNSSGLVAAVSEGSAIITASAEGKQGTSTIRVVAEQVSTVRITPTGGQVLRLGGSLQLTATPFNANNQPLAGRTVTWTTSNPLVATVNATGRVTSVALGAATITAEVEGRQGSSQVQVTPVPVGSVTVAPTGPLAMFTGTQQQLTASARDTAGNVIASLANRAVVWTSSNLPVASVSTAGVVSAVAEGTANVSVTVDGVSSAAVVVNVSRVPVASVTVTPNPAIVKVTFTQQLNATLRDNIGNPIGGRAIIWTTSDGSIVTVSTTGQIQGIAIGSATITATSEGVSGTTTVNVVP